MDPVRNLPPVEQTRRLVAGVARPGVHVDRVQELSHGAHRRLHGPAERFSQLYWCPHGSLCLCMVELSTVTAMQANHPVPWVCVWIMPLQVRNAGMYGIVWLRVHPPWHV